MGRSPWSTWLKAAPAAVASRSRRRHRCWLMEQLVVTLARESALGLKPLIWVPAVSWLLLGHHRTASVQHCSSSCSRVMGIHRHHPVCSLRSRIRRCASRTLPADLKTLLSSAEVRACRQRVRPDSLNCTQPFTAKLAQLQRLPFQQRAHIEINRFAAEFHLLNGQVLKHHALGR